MSRLLNVVNDAEEIKNLPPFSISSSVYNVNLAKCYCAQIATVTVEGYNGGSFNLCNDHWLEYCKRTEAKIIIDRRSGT